MNKVARSVEIAFIDRKGNVHRAEWTNSGTGYTQEDLDTLITKLMNDSKIVNIETRRYEDVN